MAEETKPSLWLGYVIIAIALFGIGTGAYLLYQQMKAPAIGGEVPPSTGTPPPSQATSATTGTSTPKTTAVAAPPKSEFPLQQGSRGEKTAAVQRYLNQRYAAGLVADGIWGSLTNAAMQKYTLTTSVSLAEYNNMLAWMNANAPKTDTWGNIKEVVANYSPFGPQTDQNI